MRLFIGIIAATIFISPAGEAFADCPSYQVRRGDTLRLIAERFYGRRDASGRIHAANRSKIGANPNLIEPGQTLYIPCPDPANPPGSAKTEPEVMAVKHDAPMQDIPAIRKNSVNPSASSSSGVLPRINAVMAHDGADEHEAASSDHEPAMAGSDHGQPKGGMQHDDHAAADPKMSDHQSSGQKMTDNMMDGHEQSEQSHETASMASPQTEHEDPHNKPEMTAEMMPSLGKPDNRSVIHILTGGPFAPFVGDHLPGGGMITELVSNALGRRPGPDIDIVFVNDRASHLDGIMPRGGFALAFPWPFPRCDIGEVRSEDQHLCDTYRSTDGFYEFVTEFYARADLPWAGILIPSALAGARICRPMGYPIADLYELGLMPDKVELIRGKDAIECLLMVDRAEADIASMDAAVTRSLIDRITVKNPILVLEPLTKVDKLRVLAPKSDPRSAETILRLNAGLREMSEDGSWFEIVNRHLKGGGS